MVLSKMVISRRSELLAYLKDVEVNLHIYGDARWMTQRPKSNRTQRKNSEGLEACQEGLEGRSINRMKTCEMNVGAILP